MDSNVDIHHLNEGQLKGQMCSFQRDMSRLSNLLKRRNQKPPYMLTGDYMLSLVDEYTEAKTSTARAVGGWDFIDAKSVSGHAASMNQRVDECRCDMDDLSERDPSQQKTLGEIKQAMGEEMAQLKVLIVKVQARYRELVGGEMGAHYE